MADRSAYIRPAYFVPVPHEKIRELMAKGKVDVPWLASQYPTLAYVTIANWVRGRTKKTFIFHLEDIIAILEKRITDMEADPSQQNSDFSSFSCEAINGIPRVPVPTEKIRFYFEQAGITQNKLAARAGIDQSKISQWLRGKAKTAYPVDLRKYLEAVENMVPGVKRKWELLAANLALESGSGPDKKPQ